jgi:hypothetical protein
MRVDSCRAGCARIALALESLLSRIPEKARLCKGSGLLNFQNTPFRYEAQ